MAQEEGLEPPTKRLTAACSTDWATPELIGDKVELWNYWNAKAMSSNPYFSARLSNWIRADTLKEEKQQLIEQGFDEPYITKFITFSKWPGSLFC